MGKIQVFLSVVIEILKMSPSSNISTKPEKHAYMDLKRKEKLYGIKFSRPRLRTCVWNCRILYLVHKHWSYYYIRSWIIKARFQHSPNWDQHELNGSCCILTIPLCCIVKKLNTLQKPVKKLENRKCKLFVSKLVLIAFMSVLQYCMRPDTSGVSIGHVRSDWSGLVGARAVCAW